MCGLSQKKAPFLDRLSVPLRRLSAVRTRLVATLYSKPHEQQNSDRLYALRAPDHDVDRRGRIGIWDPEYEPISAEQPNDEYRKRPALQFSFGAQRGGSGQDQYHDLRQR